MIKTEKICGKGVLAKQSGFTKIFDDKQIVG